MGNLSHTLAGLKLFDTYLIAILVGLMLPTCVRCKFWVGKVSIIVYRNIELSNHAFFGLDLIFTRESEMRLIFGHAEPKTTPAYSLDFFLALSSFSILPSFVSQDFCLLSASFPHSVRFYPIFCSPFPISLCHQFCISFRRIFFSRSSALCFLWFWFKITFITVLFTSTK